jgi:hypothetical protein
VIWATAASAAGAFIIEGCTFSQNGASQQRAATDLGWKRGTYEGCGAPWAVHDLMNAHSAAVAVCSYCRRPRFRKD